MRFRFHRIVILFCSAFFVFLGCERHKNPWAPPSFLPRIWWGKCIDWVFIGDDRATVVRKLGPPSDTLPGDGVRRYLYYEGKYAGMEIYFSLRDDKVVNVTVYRPYSGTTKEGIGIGSPRYAVIQAIGRPDASENNGHALYDHYRYGKNEWMIAYWENIVYQISFY